MPRDLVVIGAGIVGLAHAWAAARRGMSVTIVDRSPRAEGASIRNFGMVWPIGQPHGHLYARALRARALWNDAAAGAGFWLSSCGSMHLARHEDELVVLRQFAARSRDEGRPVEVLSPDDACARSPGVRRVGLVGALYSPAEACVDPREAVRAIPAWLNRAWGVQFVMGAAATGVEPGVVTLAGGQTIAANRIVVCSGHDLRSLLPETFASSGLRPCKLQMMRTAPQRTPDGAAWRLGPHLAAGLTLLHYSGFASCPGLVAVRDRFARDCPEHLRWGIHVMATQNGLGELVLGDSHEYGQDIEPFDRSLIDDLILRYLREFLVAPSLDVAERWHGLYAKAAHGATAFVREARPSVWAVTGLGGAGMTLSFGLAEDVIAHLEGEGPPPRLSA